MINSGFLRVMRTSMNVGQMNFLNTYSNSPQTLLAFRSLSLPANLSFYSIYAAFIVRYSGSFNRAINWHMM